MRPIVGLGGVTKQRTVRTLPYFRVKLLTMLPTRTYDVHAIHVLLPFVPKYTQTLAQRIPSLAAWHGKCWVWSQPPPLGASRRSLVRARGSGRDLGSVLQL